MALTGPPAIDRAPDGVPRPFWSVMIPTYNPDLDYLAQALAVQRRFMPRAGAAIAKACELNPVSPPYLKLAGKIHAELGALDKAERYYNEAIALGGEDVAVTKALEELRARSKKGRSGLFGRAS